MTKIIEILDYQEAGDIKAPKNESEKLSIIIYDSVQDFPGVIQDFLMNLTGVDLSTSEKLYDYFQKTLKYDKKSLIKLESKDLKDALNPKNVLKFDITDIFKGVL